MPNSTLQSERILSPHKLAAARIRAGYRTKGAFAKAVGISRGRYARWESDDPPTRTMYEQMRRVLSLLRVSYEDITEPAPSCRVLKYASGRELSASLGTKKQLSDYEVGAVE